MRKSVLAVACCLLFCLLATAAYALSPGDMAESPCPRGLCPAKETDTVTLPVFDSAYGDDVLVIDIFQPGIVEPIEVEVLVVEAPVKQSCGVRSRVRSCESRFSRVRRLFRGCR